MTLRPLLHNFAERSLSHKIYVAGTVRDKESVAAKRAGVSMWTLMERAGTSAYRALRNRWPEMTRIVVFVGTGNNGGDGYVLATQARQDGLTVSVYSIEPSQPLKGDALTAREMYEKEGGSVNPCSDYQDESDEHVIVDALLGTGLSGELREPYHNVIDKINASAAPVLSVDIPSGMHADTGQNLGTVIQAECTVTFVGIKSGLVTGQGKGYAGELIFDDLGIATPFLEESQPKARWIDFGSYQPLPKRKVDTHKSHYGRLLCIGGNAEMSGAIRMTAESAMRSGAGMVKVFCHENSTLAVSLGRPEIMVSSSALEEQLKWATCIAIGPGLGRDEWAETTMMKTLDHVRRTPKPLVIDADGLYWLSKMRKQSLGAKVTPLTVITPHAAEAARLLDADVQEVNDQRYLAVEELTRMYHVTSILKGAGTLIHEQGQMSVCAGGNSGMATAGMGDVLTGVVSAMLAQGMPPYDAACYSVCLHAQAGDNIAKSQGQRGMLATDLISEFVKLVNT
ncbi:NAD(P)H-hydrate dehydratase [Aestuariibacter sp. AA17]|uniref:Bifunctional NAD(P)H-hydrate repair enzyme n=1 Tax=Fluctibacter corallii TaxID=2984329 RepID=A0ABT3AD86_9ALTE|nr:NAD(P)H-hydrate dehydratase [Aestuariibacter sp. AA17]MCV2886599.1 NAD(P)H-hydrate dehydratase [Aestuariibacter sp. AA17]